MPAGRVKIAVLLLSISLASTVQPLLAKKKQKETLPSGAGPINKRALHALNRLSFGPATGRRAARDGHRCRPVDRFANSIPNESTIALSMPACNRSARCV